jgi:putative ABC transport system substrate-binding protein
VRRRDFIAVLGGAVGWSLAARAQKSAMPVIGFLCSASPTQWAPYLAAFRNDLNETGYVEGANIAIEFRWAEGHGRLQLALAGRPCPPSDGVPATGGRFGAEAKAATAVIPPSLRRGRPGRARPRCQPWASGGNATGVSIVTVDLVGKRPLLHELVPKATVVAYIVNSNIRIPRRRCARRRRRRAAFLLYTLASRQ